MNARDHEDRTLRRVAAVGPYFTLATGARADDRDFRPLRELYADPGLLARQIHAFEQRLRTAETRVAASMFHLGLAARLWSVGLGAAALGGIVPDLDPGRVHWRLRPGAPMELWAPPRPVPLPVPEPDSEIPAGPHPDDAGLAAALYECVAEQHLVPLHHATRTVTRVAERLLWGNAASALVGAARVLVHETRAHQPRHAESAERIARILQEHGRLGGSGTWRETGAFRRTTCCLFYRAPQGGICGDCVFEARPPLSRRASPT